MDTIGYLFGAIGVLLTAAAWLRPQAPASNMFRRVAVDVANHIPLYNPPHEDRLEHYVAVTLRNRSGMQVLATSWGIRVPGGGNLFTTAQPRWATQLPCWVSPGASITLLVDANELRRFNAETAVPFRKMRAWVDLADGRRVVAKKGVPLQ